MEEIQRNQKKRERCLTLLEMNKPYVKSEREVHCLIRISHLSIMTGLSLFATAYFTQKAWLGIF